MGRWTQYDEDEYRLPEGMKRVGYDADTQTYTFKDQNGDYWEGHEGQEYGELTKVGEHNSQFGADDLEAYTPARAVGYQPLGTSEVSQENAAHSRPRNAWRQLFPFLLIVLAFLLLVFRLVSPTVLKRGVSLCPEHSRSYLVKSGDTCWAIARAYGTSVEQLRAVNTGVDCALLRPGQKLCVPVAD